MVQHNVVASVPEQSESAPSFERDNSASSRRWRSIGVAVATAALWLLSRPFTFTENDGQVYAFLALATESPHRFAQDIFIRFGSQDAFSIFSSIYGWIVGLVGLSSAAMSLLLFGGALWLFGCWHLLSAILDRSRAQMALVTVAGLHIVYGGFSALYIGEGILTSRIFAEALVVIGLGELARGRRARSLALFAMAAALHPIVALAGLTVAWLSEAIRRNWLLLLAPLAGFVVLGLAAGGVAPFGRLNSTMDGQWLAAARLRNGFVFVSNWTPNDWAHLGSQMAAVTLAAIRVNDRNQRFFQASLAAAVLGMLTSWAGADVFHNALVVQLQLWRLTWPLALASIAAIFALAPRTMDARLWLAPSLLAVSLLPGSQWPTVFLALAGLTGGVLRHSANEWFCRILLVMLLGFVIAYVATILTAQIFGILFSNINLIRNQIVNSMRIYFSWLAAPFLLVFLFRYPRAALVANGVLLVVAVVVWDRRPPWQRYVMQANTPISATGPVLWGSDASTSWFLLRTPAYLSLQQASGLLFSPQTSSAWMSRLPVAQDIVPDTTWGPDEPSPQCSTIDRTLSASNLIKMCRTPDGPGAVVTRHPISGLEGAAFSTQADDSVFCLDATRWRLLHTRLFYAYDCAATKASAPRGMERIDSQ